MRQKLARVIGGVAMLALVAGGTACSSGSDHRHPKTTAACRPTSTLLTLPSGLSIVEAGVPPGGWGGHHPMGVTIPERDARAMDTPPSPAAGTAAATR